MSAESFDIAVIGGGPAGMEAAIEAARAGATTVVVDDRDRLGGNYYKELPDAFCAPESALASHRAERETTRQAVGREGVQVMRGTGVWGVFDSRGGAIGPASPTAGGAGSGEPDAEKRAAGSERPDGAAQGGFTLELSRAGEPSTLWARCLVIAPGVYDRPVPFPGWTLPGILTPGGAQLLLGNQGVLPGCRVVVGGTGPLLLPVAASLVESGADVVAFVEACGALEGWPHLRGLWGQAGRLVDGFRYWRVLRGAGVQFLFRHAVTRAHGDDRLRAVEIGRIRGDGRPVPGSERTVEVDCACVGHGFLPSTELTLHLGCRHRFDADLRARFPWHDETMETDVPGVFVAGDVTGIGGKDAARLQGRIAGAGAAARTGHMTQAELRRRAERLGPARRRQERFRQLLWRRHRHRKGLLALLESDTMVCRCEAVTVAPLVEAVKSGYHDLRGVKVCTRAGMGACQGRYCASTVAEIIDARGANTIESVSPPRIRPPVMPVRLDEIQ